MQRNLVRQALLLGVAALIALNWARAEQAPSDEERMKKLDAGPKTIDVSAYPAEQQKGYKVFAEKCSACHTVARGVNSEMVLPGDWERYVKRMMHKPNSGISSDEGKTLFRFLVYESSARKADLLKKKLGELPADERAAAIEKIKGVNPTFAP